MAAKRPEELWEGARFKLNEQSVGRFMDQVMSYWDSYHFPNMHKETEWLLHLVKPSEWFKHHSILFQSTETGKSFTVELNVSKEEGVLLLSRRFDPSKYSHLQLINLGEATMSALQLFDKAMKCAEEFGDYHAVTNNCQHFCQKLASKLGCGSSAPMTDTGKAALGIVGGVITILGVALLGIFIAKKRGKNSE